MFSSISLTFIACVLWIMSSPAGLNPAVKTLASSPAVVTFKSSAPV
jgi:hypothetical protein